LAIDRQACARQGGSAQGKNVCPFSAVHQPPAIALEFFAIRQPIMRGQNRLRSAQVGIARQNHARILIATPHQRPLDFDKTVVNLPDRLRTQSRKSVEI